MVKKIIEFFEEHKKIPFIFMLIILGVMWYCSSLPGGSVGASFSWMPVVYHLSIFAAFAFFFLVLVAKKRIKFREISLAIIVSLIVAILDEFHQSFVPGRSCTIQDVLIDMTGATVMIIACFLIKNYK